MAKSTKTTKRTKGKSTPKPKHAAFSAAEFFKARAQEYPGLRAVHIRLEPSTFERAHQYIRVGLVIFESPTAKPTRLNFLVPLQ